MHLNEEETKEHHASGAGPAPTPLGLDRDIAFAEAERRLLGRELRPVTLDRFVVLHRLGQGAMGVVYAAHDPKLDRKVALKIVDTSGFGSEGIRDAQRRLEREAKAAADLSHPNIVTIYDTGTVGDQVFLAMELVDGVTLRKWLAKPRPWREIVGLFIEIGRGLHAAHEKGIVHRDFKPDNVLVGDDGRPRVVDFGLARPVSAALRSTQSVEQAQQTTGAGEHPTDEGRQTGQPETSIAGTPAYMAPEQYEGRNIGPHSDQFGFCVALYEALLGERPFFGKNASALAAAVLAGRRKPLPRGHKVPPAVLAAVLRGLHSDPPARHRSMQALIDALARARDRRRRRLLGVAAIAVLGGSVGITYALAPATGADPVDPCDAAEAPLQAVWNDARRETVAKAMAAGSPFAADAWGGIEGRIDRLAEHWGQLRQDACHDARHRGEESMLMLELRYACLDRQLTRLDAYLQQLEQPATGTAGPSPLHPLVVDSIDRLWRCEDRERLVTTMHANGLADETDLSRNTAAVVQWEAGYGRLSRAEMLYEARQDDEALGLAESVVEDAKAAGLRALEAEGRLLLGRWTGNVSQLEQALDLAVASSAPSQAAEIAITIAEQGADDETSEALALQHLRYAERFVERDAGYVGSLPVRILAVRANLDLRNREHEAAVAKLEQALEMARRVLPPDHQDTLTVLGNLAVASSRMGDTAAATSIYEQLLEAQTRVLGPRHPDVGATLFNLGSAALSDRRLDEAERWLSRATALWLAAFGEDHPQPTLSMAAQGELHRRRGELDAAHQLQTRVLAVRQQALGPEHSALCEPLDELGEIALARGELDQARQQLDRSLEIRRATGSHGLSTTLTKLGKVLHAQGESAAAIEALEEALALRSEDGIDPLKRAETELELARVVVAEDPERARSLGSAAVQRFEAAPGRRAQERAEARAWVEHSFGLPD